MFSKTLCSVAGYEPVVSLGGDQDFRRDNPYNREQREKPGASVRFLCDIHCTQCFSRRPVLGFDRSSFVMAWGLAL